MELGEVVRKNGEEKWKEPAGPRPSISLNTLFLEFNSASPYIFALMDPLFVCVVSGGNVGPSTYEEDGRFRTLGER